MPRLSIVVPYRDRESHLQVFLPHLIGYLNEHIESSVSACEITFVEQAGSDLFNKGMLCNIGHVLTRERSEYLCIHDIDYLPLEADYSVPDNPTRVIWEGIESRPTHPGGQHVIKHDYATFFGGVVVFRHEHYEMVNGFSNAYWGWGYEDSDLRERFLAARLPIDFRDGRFKPLTHINYCFEPNGRLSALGRRNLKFFKNQNAIRRSNPINNSDGLSSLSFEVISRQDLRPVDSNGRFERISMVKVRLPGSEP